MADRTADAIKLNLRLPKPLHKRLQRQARRNNVSLNTQIVNELEGSGAAAAKQLMEALKPLVDEALEQAIERVAGSRRSELIEERGRPVAAKEPEKLSAQYGRLTVTVGSPPVKAKELVKAKEPASEPEKK
jgi:uncharacterized protein HemY